MTQKRATPSIKRRRVGGQLRRWRESVGESSADAARAMGWSQARFSRVERGYYRITREEVYDLCAKLGVDDPDGVEEVARAAEEPTGQGWWAAYAKNLTQSYGDFIELEAEAREIQMHHPVVVPGLFQTPGYARELIFQQPSAVTPGEAEDLVSVRLARQAVMGRVEKVHALVPESALHARLVSGPGVMKDQIRRLIDVSEMSNVELQLIPLTAHPTYGAIGAMTILSFRSPWSTVGSVDSPLGGHHTEDVEQVNVLQRDFTAISSIALAVDKSRDCLNHYLEGLHA
ncbi:helix-turn-helix domain-containing protein [Streptomyces sp. NPDC002454]